MTRSRWKPNFLSTSYLKSASFVDINVSKQQKIVLDFKDKSLTLTNGLKSFSIQISNSHLGSKFGEYVFTRSRKK